MLRQYTAAFADPEKVAVHVLMGGRTRMIGMILRLPECGGVPYDLSMPTTPETAAFDRGVRPVLEIVLPDRVEAVLSFRADPELQARIEELASKSTEGQLTEAERAEYEGYVRANKFVAILQRQARHMVGSQS